MSNEYTSVANQRVITTKKEECNKDNIYTPINLSALREAMPDLNGNEFKMWVYLGKNKDGYTFALSKVDCIRWCGFSESTYGNAFKGLVAKGYLIQRNDGSNHYDFYEVAQDDKPLITTHKSKDKFVF